MMFPSATPPDVARARLRERFAIDELQCRAHAANEAGQHEEAAALYDDAAARWEALGGYGDFASGARHMARKCRRLEKAL